MQRNCSRHWFKVEAEPDNSDNAHTVAATATAAAAATAAAEKNAFSSKTDTTLTHCL